MTTPDPGLKLVLIYGETLNPFSTARLARSPAPNITDGFDVFVQLVIADITTDPTGRDIHVCTYVNWTNHEIWSIVFPDKQKNCDLLDVKD